jgi:hypothetical protein
VDLRGANLRSAWLKDAHELADLRSADLRDTNLSGADLIKSDLSGASLNRADLTRASLIETDLTNADLTDCHIYGISAWELRLSEGTKQQNLVITRAGESEVTADDIEVAQFLYLMLHNVKIRRIIDTITSKVVLILGRFTPERKAVLDALRDQVA